MKFRFGFKVGGRIFPNAGVIVFPIEKHFGEVIIEAVSSIRLALILSGQGAYADKIVAEFRE
jgi:hypothetical protein